MQALSDETELPRVVNVDSNLVTGERVELDLNTDTTIIVPDKESGGRVKAFFYPSEKEKK